MSAQISIHYFYIEAGIPDESSTLSIELQLLGVVPDKPVYVSLADSVGTISKYN
jgi:hypothetical protein